MVWNMSDLNPNAKTFNFSVGFGRHTEPKHWGKRSCNNLQPRPALAQLPPQVRSAKRDAAAAARRRRHSVDAIDFTGLKMVDVATFLRHIRLHKYTEVLLAANISFAQMLRMTDAELEAVGVRAKGARTRLLKANERYNSFLASSSGFDGYACLDTIIPTNSFDSPRSRSRRNSAPSGATYANGRKGPERTELIKGPTTVYSSNDSNQYYTAFDDDFSALVPSMPTLLSVIDENGLGQFKDDDSSFFSRAVPGDQTSFSRRNETLGTSQATNTKGFDLWATNSPYQTLCGLQSSVGVL